MDWIEFVSQHSGSPFASKMRHQNIRGKGEEMVLKVEKRAVETASTLAKWLKATEQKISLEEALKY